MTILPIPNALAARKYRGSGYALAAHDGARVADLVYLRDALPDFDDPSEDEGEDVREILIAAIECPALRPAIEQLRAQGQVSIGMCSSGVFIEL